MSSEILKNNIFENNLEKLKINHLHILYPATKNFNTLIEIYEYLEIVDYEF